MEHTIKDKIADILHEAKTEDEAIKMMEKILPDDPDIIDLFVLQFGLALCKKFYVQLKKSLEKGVKHAEEFYMPESGDHTH